MRTSELLRVRKGRLTRSGFTLVELLTVVGIIVILAGLILGTAGYVQKKGARARAETEIAAMEAALENYKADNGAYPESTLGISTNTNPGDTGAKILYFALSGDPNATHPEGETHSGTPRTYMEFNPNMLKKTGTTVDYVQDPWGNPYGYSTAGGRNPATSFDLWSTAGARKSGTDPDLEERWVKNW